MSKPAFIYKADPNGPLASRVRLRQIILSKVDIMIEDRDATTDLSREPDLSDFPDWACQFFGANLSTEDTADVEADDDEHWLDREEDSGLSDEEWAEMKEFNQKNGTDYYRDDDLLILRRHESQLWFNQTYCQDTNSGDHVEIDEVEGAVLNNDEDDVVEVQHQTWVIIDEVAVPSQTSVQYDDYVKQLGWGADKYNRGWQQSHGGHGRQNPFWRRAIRKNRGHRRQMWADMTDETEDLTSHLEDLLRDFEEHEAFKADMAFLALDQAYQNSEFDDPLPVRPSYTYLDDDWCWDDDWMWGMAEPDSVPEPDWDDTGWDDGAWFEIDLAEEQRNLDRLADTIPIQQHGGLRGQRAIKGVERNLCRPHHFLASAS